MPRRALSLVKLKQCQSRKQVIPKVPCAYRPLDVVGDFLEMSQRFELLVKGHEAHLLDVELVHSFLSYKTALVR